MTPGELADLAHLRRARDLIDREYARPLDVPELARQALMSPSHFARRFRAAYGETPYSYLMTRRIERAQDLLRRGDLSVTEVCLAVGCTSLGSFSSRFTELVGMTPSAYRALDHSSWQNLPPKTVMVGTRPSVRAESEKRWMPAARSVFGMTITVSHFPVHAVDVDATVAFYRDALGLEVVNDVPYGEFRWVTLATPGSSVGQIVISQPHAGRSEQEGDQIASLVALGAFGPIVFDSDDLDAAFERARASGLGEVLQEPMDQGWGVRDCAFRDPAGNMIRIGEKKAA